MVPSTTQKPEAFSCTVKEDVCPPPVLEDELLEDELLEEELLEELELLDEELLDEELLEDDELLEEELEDEELEEEELLVVVPSPQTVPVTTGVSIVPLAVP